MLSSRLTGVELALLGEGSIGGAFPVGRPRAVARVGSPSTAASATAEILVEILSLTEPISESRWPLIV